MVKFKSFEKMSFLTCGKVVCFSSEDDVPQTLVLHLKLGSFLTVLGKKQGDLKTSNRTEK